MIKATYYSDLNFLFVCCTGHIEFALLSAKIAEWIIEIGSREGRLVFVDLRRLRTVDDLSSGSAEYVNMQKKLYETYPAARRIAFLADRPETFVMVRAFEQLAQENFPSDMDVFRNSADALSFLGLEGDDIDTFVERLTGGQTLA
ncbi:hypothetical protein [Aliiroseovarius sp. 2305UL8-7]|uniref:hypothetical protein n=1 Tax=Aliiroseovarius conchicola TaxID=3121637 RepID=UPI003528DA42